MHSLNGTKVTSVRLVETYHINGVGQVGPGAITKEGPNGARKLPLDIVYVDGGVSVSGTNNGAKFLFFIPASNIIGMDLDASSVPSRK